MKKYLLVIVLLLFTSGSVLSQNNNEQSAIENEVNESVWKPFKKSFETKDWQLFNDLHTDDVLRVGSWGIRLGSEYKEGNKASFQRPNGAPRSIDFWLEHRIYSGDVGYEVGYYRITSKQPGLESRISYARFHIVLKKINGKWKIAQDWDTSNVNGNPITEEDFNKGTPLDL